MQLANSRRSFRSRLPRPRAQIAWCSLALLLVIPNVHGQTLVPASSSGNSETATVSLADATWSSGPVTAAVTDPLAGLALPSTGPSDAQRVADLEADVRLLQLQLDALLQPDHPSATADVPQVPQWIWPHDPQETAACCPEPPSVASHYLTYDDGWILRPRRPVESPFELKFNVHNQFRYTGFARRSESYIDSAGNVQPIANRNDFDINRGRFVFSGYAFHPNFGFYTNIDYNTVATNPVLLLLSWFSYKHSDALTIYGGLGKVPGTWEWLESSRYTLGAERTMATTFFRPSITAGVWAKGRMADNLHYQLLVGDGFNTFTLRATELDTNLAYSGSLWWEPLGDFGTGFSDLEQHPGLSMRLGHGLSVKRSDGDPTGEPGPEQTLIRLSDGTRLVEPGALAPGVTVNRFNIALYALHLGLKRRGVSFAAEYFLRWLSSLEGTGDLPVSSLFDHGFYVQGGLFLKPERWEVYGISSRVMGDFGNGTEFGAGMNWYLHGKRGARITFDVNYLQDSPAEQDRTGLIAGASGALFRTQLWTFF